jgi:hypothetical protein
LTVDSINFANSREIQHYGAPTTWRKPRAVRVRSLSTPFVPFRSGQMLTVHNANNHCGARTQRSKELGSSSSSHPALLQLFTTPGHGPAASANSPSPATPRRTPSAAPRTATARCSRNPETAAVPARVMAGGGTWWQALLGMLVAVVRCSWCCSALGAPHRRRAVPPRRRQVASCSADHSWQDLPRSCPHVRLLRAGHSFSGPSAAAIRPTS